MKYVRNEWMKLWSKKGTWAMLIILLVVVIGFSTLEKVFQVKENTEETWQQSMKDSIEMYSTWIEDGDEALVEEVAVLQYQLDNNISSGYVTTFSDTVNYGVNLLTLITIFAVIVAAGIVSSEFGTGTIKMLLTRPVKRWKILLSKLVTVILFGLFLYAITIAVSALLGLVFYGPTSSVTVQMVDGVIKEISPWGYIVESALLSFSKFIMAIIFAFLIGSIFRSSSLAVGLTLIFMLMGTTIIALLSRYSFTKYIWLAHTDLTQHMDGRQPIIEGTTMGFSVTILIVYAIIFLAATFITFEKRDITA